MLIMVNTFYLHLEFKNKTGDWSINLPFLCIKCGACCKLEDFLFAGEVTANHGEHPEVHAKIKALFEELGKMWKIDEAKYDHYIAKTPCSFLVNNACSIYEIRPLGCQLFPKTTFGMQTQDCPSLNRFKKQHIALKKGRPRKETFFFTGSANCEEPIKPSNLNEKQYRACITKLSQAGMTDDELSLFNYFNCKNKE